MKLSDTARVLLSRASQHPERLAEPPRHLPAAAREAVVRSLLKQGLLEEVPAPRERRALAWRQDEDGAQVVLRITDAGLRAIGVEVEPTTAPDERQGAAPPIIAGDISRPSEAERDLPTAGQGESLAASGPGAPSGGDGHPQSLERPPVAQRRPVPRASALRDAAAAVLAAWDADGRPGLNQAIAALRPALATRARTARQPGATRKPRQGTKQEQVLALLRRPEGASGPAIAEATGWAAHTVRGFLAGLPRRGLRVEVLERVRQVRPGKEGAKGSYSIYRIATPQGA
ncbi:MAG TPA: DUF3489 domain-containing protein [Acetobacteraceae bacterium]|nr:DUF3489 domain-containing protein [Acetobacteraceae bacterium]